MGLIFKITVAILLAHSIELAVGTAYVKYQLYEAEQALKQANQRRLDKKLKEVVKRDKQRKQQKEKEALEARRRRQAAENKKEYEKAWNAYYKEPEECQVFTSERQMIECSNHRIRARSTFNEQYKNKTNALIRIPS